MGLDSLRASIQAQDSLGTRTYQAILEAICDGRLAPGERLHQEQLAQALNVSRQPVVQALRLLEAQGFVTAVGRRGLVVATPDLKFIYAVYELRAALDPLSARRAAGRLDAEAVERGRDLLAAGRLALDRADVWQIVQTDADFHRFLYESSGNPILSEVMELYWNHLRGAMVEVLSARDQAELSWDEHEAILDAVIDGDGETAADLSRKHVELAAQRFLLRRAGSKDG